MHLKSPQSYQTPFFDDVDQCLNIIYYLKTMSHEVKVSLMGAEIRLGIDLSLQGEKRLQPIQRYPPGRKMVPSNSIGFKHSIV